MPVTFLALCQILSDINKVIQFLRERNVLKKGKFCENCQKWMTQVVVKSKSDKYMWRCSRCRKSVSIRDQSFWSEQGLGLDVYVAVLFLFAVDVPGNIALRMLSPIGCGQDGAVNEHSLYTWYNLYRDIMSRYMLENPVFFHRTEVVEIDESKWGRKRKYNRGRNPNNQPWVFGMIGRTSGKAVIFTVDRRTADSLIPKIRDHVEVGSTIFSDDWAAYRQLPRQGYEHGVVVHKDNYVDPVTGVHTNTIEGFWGNAKNPFKQMHGVFPHQLNAHLDEVTFRWNHKGEDIFELLLQHIARYYIVEDQVPADVAATMPQVQYRYQAEVEE